MWRSHLGKASVALTLLVLCLQLTITTANASSVSGKPNSHTPAISQSTPTPPCKGVYCDGLDPFSTNCGYSASYNSISWIPTNILQNKTSGAIVGTVTNYYSSWCNANWTEATMCNNTGINIVAIANAGFGNEHDEHYPSGTGFYYGQNGYPTWTNMVDGTNTVYSCATLSTWLPHFSYKTCVSQ